MSAGDFDWAHEYFLALEESGGAAWVDRVEGSLRGDLAGPAVLALLHPQWLRPVFSDRQIEDMLGPRVFRRAPAGHASTCQAVRLWGYRCPILDPNPPRGDHLFPRSAGGVTTVQNYLPLCERHNAVKSSDIHLYPYFEKPQKWVFESLRTRVRRYSLAVR